MLSFLGFSAEMDTLLPLKIPPGMRQTGTVYQSKGRWFTGNFVRFFQDTIQPIGGWSAQSLTGATITGVPRAIVSYQLTDFNNVVVLGTTSGLFAIKATVVYDITPTAVSGNNAARVWQLDIFGTYVVAVNLIAPSTGGAIYYWAGDTAALALPIDNGYHNGSIRLGAAARSIVATPERFLVQLGGTATNATP